MQDTISKTNSYISELEEPIKQDLCDVHPQATFCPLAPKSAIIF